MKTSQHGSGYAGVLPYALHSGGTSFLVGKEHKEIGWTGSERISDFGGKVDPGETLPGAALREWWEESMGVLGEKDELRAWLEAEDTLPVDVEGGKMYLVRIPYDPSLPRRFSSVYRYVTDMLVGPQGNTPGRSQALKQITPEGAFEKKEIRWWRAEELVVRAHQDPSLFRGEFLRSLARAREALPTLFANAPDLPILPLTLSIEALPDWRLGAQRVLLIYSSGGAETQVSRINGTTTAYRAGSPQGILQRLKQLFPYLRAHPYLAQFPTDPAGPSLRRFRMVVNAMVMQDAEVTQGVEAAREGGYPLPIMIYCSPASLPRLSRALSGHDLLSVTSSRSLFTSFSSFEPFPPRGTLLPDPALPAPTLGNDGWEIYLEGVLARDIERPSPERQDSRALIFRAIEERFVNFLGRRSHRLVSVVQLSNPRLLKRFLASAPRGTTPERWGYPPREDRMLWFLKQAISEEAPQVPLASSDGNAVLVWHGTDPRYIASIASDGFTYFGKTDVGYYGVGAYFSNFGKLAEQYSHDSGFLLLSWAWVGLPFLCTKDQQLLGRPTPVPGFDSNYVLVSDPGESVATTDLSEVRGDELVIPRDFATARTLPMFVVEYEASE